MKRWISLFLAMTLLISCLPVPARATETEITVPEETLVMETLSQEEEIPETTQVPETLPEETNLPEETEPQETEQEETAAPETLPEETQETVPGDTLTPETIPEETVPETTVPKFTEEETVPELLSDGGVYEIPFQINPLYEGLVSPEAMEQDLDPIQSRPASRAVADYLPFEDAVAVIKAYMLYRLDTFTISICSTETELKPLINSIFAEACTHTGDPVEGDYLRWQYGGWRASYSYSYDNEGNYYYSIDMQVPYYTSSSQESQMDTAVSNLLDSLDLDGKSDYEKVKAIYDYITANITYDNANLKNEEYKLKYTAYAALINGTAVCQGYANLLYRLCLEVGVDCRFIGGTGNGGPHGWNIIDLENLYYNADSTWDAGWYSYNCFLVCPANFDDHVRDAEYDTAEFHAAYPMASSDYTAPDHVHTPVADAAVAATCTADGLTAGSHCSGCGFVLEAQQVIPASGHEPVIDKRKEATCTEDGLTEGSHCFVCGEILDAQEVIPAADHSYEGIYTEPTFDADGFTTYTCSVCGDSYTETDPGTMKTAAAAIGDNKYETLAEAFAAAKEGDTIEMLVSYTIAAGTTESWDLTGKTLAISRTGVGIYVEGTLNILGGTFRFTEGYEHLVVKNNGQAAIEDGTFYVCGQWGIWVNHGLLTINGGTFYVTGDGYIGTQARPSGSNKFSRMTINDGVFYFRENGALYDYGLSSIKGGTFYLENQKKASIIAGYSDYRDALTITGGTYYIGGPVGIRADYYSQCYIHGGTFLTTIDGAQILQNDGAALGVYGGTYSQDMSDYLGADYCCQKHEDYYVVARHSFTEEKVADEYLKMEAGCDTGAEYYRSCACGKAGTDTFFFGEPLGHSFTNYVPNNNATCTDNGTGTAECDRGCGATDEQEIPDSALGHSYQNGICTLCGDVNGCGENLNWTLENGVLTISGTGPMYDFSLENPAPWHGCREEIRELIIENGVTTIGSYAFYSCKGLTSVVIPESVIFIGAYAFGDCTNLKDVEIPDSVEKIDGNAWSGSGVGSVVIPGGSGPIDENDFEGCEGLTEIWFRGDFPGISENAFRNVTATAYYPADNVTWTADKLQNYGGTITWKPYCLGEHTVVIDEAVPATCTTDGLTEGKHCSVCGEILVAQEVIPAGHNVVNGVCTGCGVYGTCGDNLIWELDTSARKLTISGEGAMYDYSGSSGPWKAKKSAIHTVVIEPGVTNVGASAFMEHSVSSVTLPEGLISIDDYAFVSCGALTTIALPDSLERIGYSAFYDSALNYLTMPAGFKQFGTNAFLGSNLREITFLGDVPGFTGKIFYNLRVTAYYPADNATWTEEAREKFGGTTTWIAVCKEHTVVIDEAVPATCTTDGLTEGKHCSACGEILLAQEVIPGGHDVVDRICTRCGVYGTCGDDLTWALNEESGTLTVSGTGETWNFYAEDTTAPWTQKQASIRQIIVEEGVTGLGMGTFRDCSEAESISLPDSLLRIETISLPVVEEITIPAGVTYISPFCGVDVIANVRIEEGNAYYMIEDGVLYDKEQTTLLCSTGSLPASYQIPEGVVSITDVAFSHRENLTQIIFPESLEVIGVNAFTGCTGLTEIRIPAGVTTVGYDAFKDCTSLVKITFEGDAPSVVSLPDEPTQSIFAGVTATAYYPGNSSTWGETVRMSYGGTITWEAVYPTSGTCGNKALWAFDAESGTLTISGSGSMDDYSRTNRAPWWGFRKQIASLVIQSGISGLGDYAFNECTSLEQISWQNTLSDFGEYTFRGCTSLTEVTVPGIQYDGVGKGMFWGCTSLRKVILEEPIDTIEDYAFNGCTALEEISFSDKMYSVGRYAFQNCTALKTAVVPQLQNCVFSGCTGLTEVTVLFGNYGVARNGAFMGCENLETVTFLGAVPENFTEGVFEGVTATVYYPAEAPDWKQIDQAAYGGTMSWMPLPLTGSCGTEMTYAIDPAAGTLTLSGTGTLDGWDRILNIAPWRGYEHVISHVIVEDGIAQFANLGISYERITFQGSAPESFTSDAFACSYGGVYNEDGGTVYYPVNDSSWDSVVGKSFGGGRQWIKSGSADAIIKDICDRADSLTPEQICAEVQAIGREALLEALKSPQVQADLYMLDNLVISGLDVTVNAVAIENVPALSALSYSTTFWDSTILH